MESLKITSKLKKDLLYMKLTRILYKKKAQILLTFSMIIFFDYFLKL
jgi:hypothetical protein